MVRAHSIDSSAIREQVTRAVSGVQVTDIHTHIYPPAFGDLLLWGIDELLTYHYLIAETMRYVWVDYEEFWALPKRDQADIVWNTLFVERSPVSEACRGVLTTLEQLGLDVSSRNLQLYRQFFAEQKLEDYVGRVFELAGVSSVIMTNDPFDDLELPCWLESDSRDSRFRAALRLDVMLNTWHSAVPKLRAWGYDVCAEINSRTVSEVKRFLVEWLHRMDAVYMAVSLSPDFAFPETSPRGQLIGECVLPVAAETGKPFAMMIGVKKMTNPALRLAGDSVGKANIDIIEYLCANYKDVKFLITMLSRENQHELCVAARKFRNLHVFGCWWFLNNPSLIGEITRMRLELLGLSITPQHSDARVLDQLIYKWAHSRAIIANVLSEKYIDLAATGWLPTEDEIRRDVEALFGGNFWSFIRRA
ncbi:MAG: glucuronate isomerase [Armatimonadota bacterium]